MMLIFIVLKKLIFWSHYQSENVLEGNNCKLIVVNEHATHELAYNMCIGQFARSQADLLCVQSLSCTLTVYEAEQALLHRTLPNALIPGPIAYASYSESIIVTSGGVLSSFKYNSLVTATSGNHGKKLVVCINK